MGVPVQELVPPTVPVPLAVLTDDPELGLRQVAGPRRTGTAVHTVHTSEMADPLPYLLGGELLLSAGVHCPAGSDGVDADAGPDGDGCASAEAHWERYVTRSVQAGAAALGFGIAPVHERIPRRAGRRVRPARAAAAGGARRTPRSPPSRAPSGRRSRSGAIRRCGGSARHSRRSPPWPRGPHPVTAVLAQLAQRLDAWAVLLGDGRSGAGDGRDARPRRKCAPNSPR